MTTFELSLNYAEQDEKAVHHKILTRILDGMGFEHPSVRDFATLIYSPTSTMLSVLYRSKTSLKGHYSNTPKLITKAPRRVRASIQLAFECALVYRAGAEHMGPLPADQLGPRFVTQGVLN